MSIVGTKKEDFQEQSRTLYVGIFEAKVIAVNPTVEQLSNILGKPMKEDAKEFEYLGENSDGDRSVRIDIWLEEVTKRIDASGKPYHEKFKVTFFLEQREKLNKDGDKKQYINAVGATAWASDPNNLLSWFKSRDYRVAYVGEADLYKFVTTWLSKINYRSAETSIDLEFNRLIKGDVRSIRNEINGEWCNNILALACVHMDDKDGGEFKAYQRVFNRDFLYSSYFNLFKNNNFDHELKQKEILGKKGTDRKPYERFIASVVGEYGCKDFYTLKPLMEYDPVNNPVANNSVISNDGSDY